MSITNSNHNRVTPQLVGRDDEARLRHQLPLAWPQVQLAGTVADLLETDDALGVILHQAERPEGSVLGVVSVNLDHLHHFGSGRPASRRERKSVLSMSVTGHARWLALLDGAPLVRRASELTGRPWPRLAGSDLIEPVLDESERRGLRIGFLGGSPLTHEALRPVMGRRWPKLTVAGYWAPSRPDLERPHQMQALAETIRRAGVDILVVCLGKPWQERWIAAHGTASGAGVCLAFGAVVDFLAGRVERAPRAVADHGLEWAWRLAREPRRLSRRYLVQGPRAYLALQRDSFASATTTYFQDAVPPLRPVLEERGPAFSTGDRAVDVGVVIVSDEPDDRIARQVASLRRGGAAQSVRVVVVRSGGARQLGPVSPTALADVIVLSALPVDGWTDRLGLGFRALGQADCVLVLEEGVHVEPGAIRALRQRLLHGGVAAAVPKVVGNDGWVEPTLTRRGSSVRTAADVVFRDRLRRRPGWLSSIDWSSRSYRYPHPVQGCRAPAVLLSAAATHRLVPWLDEHPSPMTAYLGLLRTGDQEVWFEPLAAVRRPPVAARPVTREERR